MKWFSVAIVLAGVGTSSADLGREKYRLSRPVPNQPVGDESGKHYPTCPDNYVYKAPESFEVVSSKSGFTVDGAPWDFKGNKDVMKLYKREEASREVFIEFLRKRQGIAYLIVLVKEEAQIVCGVGIEMTYERI